jgi:hypothetical protein
MARTQRTQKEQKIYDAVVKFKPYKDPIQTEKRGLRINAVFVLDENGKEIKVWGDPDDYRLKSLRKGQPARVFYADGDWHLVDDMEYGVNNDHYDDEEKYQYPDSTSSRVIYPPFNKTENGGIKTRNNNVKTQSESDTYQQLDLWTPENTISLEEKITYKVKLLAFCLNQVNAECKTLETEESKLKAATILFNDALIQ